MNSAIFEQVDSTRLLGDALMMILVWTLAQYSDWISPKTTLRTPKPRVRWTILTLILFDSVLDYNIQPIDFATSSVSKTRTIIVCTPSHQISVLPKPPSNYFEWKSNTAWKSWSAQQSCTSHVISFSCVSRMRRHLWCQNIHRVGNIDT